MCSKFKVLFEIQKFGTKKSRLFQAGILITFSEEKLSVKTYIAFLIILFTIFAGGLDDVKIGT